LFANIVTMCNFHQKINCCQ